ncbi:hypothetical protein CMUS01_06739 [Colletotrichum musicola]|uniref:Uncharacterized protein n=1 Tax=Colletotrichum musicola TaxID=2175873 RepID=A0A8H6KL61_9PEZI|nr:hypothetical protein CMUS01_06739 [Colletotrichum musicola]
MSPESSTDVHAAPVVQCDFGAGIGCVNRPGGGVVANGIFGHGGKSPFTLAGANQPPPTVPSSVPPNRDLVAIMSQRNALQTSEDSMV